MKIEEKTFLLGIGAQKSGTTWLYRYLSKNQNVNFGEHKEYHIWDAIYIEQCRGFIAKENDSLRYELQTNPGAYEKYFLSLINDKTNFTGDISPSYSGLSKKHFEIIRKKLESSGFDIKIVFLMRDPFERCWSAVRMEKRNKGGIFSEIDRLKKDYRSEHFVFRTNYKKTIQSIEAVFDNNKIYYGIYEEMFTAEKIKTLSDFLRISYTPEFSNQKFNTSPRLDNEALALMNEIREYYAFVYDFCYERFPQTKQLWAPKT